MNSSGNSFIGRIIGGFIMAPIFILIGGGVAFFIGKPIIDDAKRSESWPSVTGVVERSEISSHRDSDGNTMYSAEVEYRYEIEGQEHRSDQVAFGGDWSSSSQRMVRGVIEPYPVGTEVDVYYDPEFTDNAVLETGTSWSSYFVFAFGMVFLIVGLLIGIATLLPLLLGGAVLAGVIGGLIGKKSGSTTYNSDPRNPDRFSPPPQDQPAPPPRSNSTAKGNDDGFDLG